MHNFSMTKVTDLKNYIFLKIPLKMNVETCVTL